MKAERARLARLQRLERIRAVAKQSALAEAGRAECTLAQLLALAERTERMHGDYAPRAGASDGQALDALHAFRAGLDTIARGTRADADRARAVADARTEEAILAERRRAAVEDRVRQSERRITRKVEAANPADVRKALGGGSGTGLE
ncbi:MAG: hypothetical protein KGL48_16565 [Sphingomonadales bacterium]|nr:hypothetical protein [Sphingomonadales bacterium]MDE2569044.1 hypothetical protein [Sphingomonadales bacterium]